MNNPINENSLNVNGLRIHCYQSGSRGKPIILLHGGGVDSAHLSWSPVIAALGADFRVFAPDLPGYGQSDKPDVVYSIEYYTDFLRNLMDALDLEKASLIGISLGGGIALSYALGYPDRVVRLVPVDAYGLTNRYQYHFISWLYVHSWLNELSFSVYKNRKVSDWGARASGIIHDPNKLTKELLDELFEAANAPGGGKAFMSFQRSEIKRTRVRTDFTPRLHEINVPTLFIQGEKDTAVPMDAVKRAAVLVPGAELHIMAGCGHWANREAPDEFLDTVREFLAR